MIREVISDENVFSREKIDKLTNEQNKYVTNIIKKAVDYSVNNGVDILQIARLVEKQHINDWADLEGDWDEVISDIEYKYVIQSKISKSFILGKER